jgi:HPt (histidine-containing phosphotransfer) domain-containing protein
MSGAQDHYIGAGMDDYVSKPIQPIVLLAKLAELALEMPLAAADSNDETESRAESEAIALTVIDATCLATLDSMMEPEDVREFLQLYLDQTDARVDRILQFSSEGDLSAVAREAHTLVGTSGNVGAKQVSTLARSLEEACKAGDCDAAKDYVASLRQASGAASTALRARLAGNSGPVIPAGETGRDGDQALLNA